MIKYIGDILPDAVPANEKKATNAIRGWKYGYNKKYDLIVISKDGTLGEVFEVNGLKIGIPEKPKDKKIQNYGTPKHNQVWTRSKLPKGLNAHTQYNQEFEEFIAEQFRRRSEGHWIFINGEAFYMTGTTYYFLNWVRLDEGYPNFRAIQNDLMIYWEACKADTRCYGICYVKNRRFGWTSIAIGECLNEGTAIMNKLLGLISKTREDSKSMFNKLVMAFKRLPSFFQPIWDGTTTPKSELLMTAPTRKRSSKDDYIEEEGINTRITFYATVLNAMDGEKVFRSVLDEFGKFPKETPADRYWSIVKTSHRVGGRIVGKSMVGSTVNALKKGGKEFKKVYYQSDPTERNKNGQTASGLYKLFIPAQYCIEGYFDKYGFSIVDDPIEPIENEYGELVSIGANTYLDNELDGLRESPEEYNEFLRQFARTEAHAFRDEATDCSFNLTKIYEQTDYNEQEGAHHIIRGNFHWKDGIQDGEVVWSPSPDGRFYITNQPRQEFRNRFEMKMQHGVYAKAPVAGHLGAFGVDPYNRSRTAHGKGSKGSIHLYTKGNFEQDWPSNTFVLEYIDRPPTVELFYEDVIMAMRYYSMPILAELSNEDFLKTLVRRKYRHFILNRPDKKWRELSPTEKELGGVPPQGQVIADAQYYAVEAYIEDHVGVAMNSDIRPIGDMGAMYFNRTLDQWKDVDPDKRTKYDAYISSSLALIANRRWKHQKDERPKRKFAMPFSTYDNSGKFSKVK